MIKKLKLATSLFLFTCLSPVVTLSQNHKLVKLWETDSVFKVPESVLFDKASNTLFISNIDGTEPWGKDGKGSVGKMNADGKNITVEWVTGLNAPKGMGLYKGKLYVADLTELVVIDVASGMIEKRISVPGADRLNDVSIGKKGVVFVSDSRGRKVYEVKNEKADELLDSFKLKGPNGVLKHKADLYVLDAGTMYKMNKDKTLIKITEGMDGGTDGIENVKGGDFIVSCWAGTVWYVNADGTKELLLDGRPDKKNSADIGFDAKTKTVFIPSFWRNTVAAYEVK
ncbi:MAG: ATP/GTP-binding protein [Bacteroidetes bacterium]|nr:MAG: ATP/GTP-binding protein [Bacteroidota bacterium]